MKAGVQHTVIKLSFRIDMSMLLWHSECESLMICDDTRERVPECFPLFFMRKCENTRKREKNARKSVAKKNMQPVTR